MAWKAKLLLVCLASSCFLQLGAAQNGNNTTSSSSTNKPTQNAKIGSQKYQQQVSQEHKAPSNRAQAPHPRVQGPNPSSPSKNNTQNTKTSSKIPPTTPPSNPPYKPSYTGTTTPLLPSYRSPPPSNKPQNFGSYKWNGNAKDTIIEANMRFLGQSVLPFTLQKQNAVISGISNALQNGISASDISLRVIKTYDSITPDGNRRLRQLLQSSFPAADVQINITTTEDNAQNQSNALKQAANQTYALATSIGQQGLQTQQIIVQNTSIIPATQTSPPPPPPSQSPPPPASPPPSVPPPVQSPATTSSSGSETPVQSFTSQSPPPAQAPPPQSNSTSASGTGNSATGSTQSNSGSSISGGAIGGIAAGGAIIIALLAGLLILLRRRRRSKMAEQSEVIDYYSGVGKPGTVSRPIVANSSNQVPSTSENYARSANGVSPIPYGGPNPQKGNVDEKVEYSEGGEKAEVPRQRDQTAFMNVQL